MYYIKYKYGFILNIFKENEEIDFNNKFYIRKTIDRYQSFVDEIICLLKVRRKLLLESLILH